MNSRALTVLILLTLTSSAQAQLVTYQFTGSVIDGVPAIGSTVTGALTLDLGATPTFCNSNGFSPTDFCVWQQGLFTVDAVTDTGVIAGTSLGGDTYFTHRDLPVFSRTEIGSTFSSEELYCQITVVSLNPTAGLDNDGSTIPDLWNPLADPFQQIDIRCYDPRDGEELWATFSIDTFTTDSDGDGIIDSEDACPNSDMSDTVNIQGIETGVTNHLNEDGCTIVDLIHECATDAKNHGQFVKCVAALTNSLRTQGIITGREKAALQRAAAKAKLPE